MDQRGEGMDHKKENCEEKDIDNLLKILDGFCEAQESRMKLEISEDIASGDVQHRYHHGRCDIGSPWACGTAFDVLENPEE